MAKAPLPFTSLRRPRTKNFPGIRVARPLVVSLVSRPSRPSLCTEIAPVSQEVLDSLASLALLGLSQERRPTHIPDLRNRSHPIEGGSWIKQLKKKAT